MAFVAGTADLATAVASAGGIGGIGVGFTPPEELRAMIRSIREVTDGPFHLNFLTIFGNDEQAKVAAEEQVPIVSYHWGHPPLEQLAMLRDAGVSIWEQVGSVEAAELAVADGADAVIAQSWEAGGHNYGGLPAMVQIPTIVDAVGDRAMVLAAGGISDGRQVAAALCLGADGVWVGTRLVASEEAVVHPEHHARIVEATSDDAVMSSIFGPENPGFNPMRLLKNRVVNEWNDRLDEVPMDRDDLEVVGETVFLGQTMQMRKFPNLLPVPETTGDWEEMPWLAGQGVGLIHDIRPAGEIVHQMMAEAERVLRTHA